MYTIQLQDGTKLEGLSVNGSYFASDNEIDRAIFDRNLNHVVISCDEADDDFGGICGVHEHMRLAHMMRLEGKYLFFLADIPQNEIELEQIKANIEYLAMMADIEL